MFPLWYHVSNPCILPFLFFIEPLIYLSSLQLQTIYHTPPLLFYIFSTFFMCISKLNLLSIYRTFPTFHSFHVVTSYNLYISYQESAMLSNIFVTPANTILFYLLRTSLFAIYLSSLQLQTAVFFYIFLISLCTLYFPCVVYFHFLVHNFRKCILSILIIVYHFYHLFLEVSYITTNCMYLRPPVLFPFVLWSLYRYVFYIFYCLFFFTTPVLAAAPDSSLSFLWNSSFPTFFKLFIPLHSYM